MQLHNLKPTPGARKDKHRVGRGHAAGKGKQAVEDKVVKQKEAK